MSSLRDIAQQAAAVSGPHDLIRVRESKRARHIDLPVYEVHVKSHGDRKGRCIFNIILFNRRLP